MIFCRVSSQYIQNHMKLGENYLACAVNANCLKEYTDPTTWDQSRYEDKNVPMKENGTLQARKMIAATLLQSKVFISDVFWNRNHLVMRSFLDSRDYVSNWRRSSQKQNQKKLVFSKQPKWAKSNLSTKLPNYLSKQRAWFFASSLWTHMGVFWTKEKFKLVPDSWLTGSWVSYDGVENRHFMRKSNFSFVGGRLNDFKAHSFRSIHQLIDIKQYQTV